MEAVLKNGVDYIALAGEILLWIIGSVSGSYINCGSCD